MDSPKWIEGAPVVVVTGGTGGIGRATVESLLGMGVHVVLAARDVEKARRLCETAEADHGQACVTVVACDLASFASVRRAADEICAAHPAIDGIIANAGVIASRRELTEDGHELTFQVNHLSHFLLTNLLRPALTAGSPSRVVVVSSDAHRAAWRGLHLEDLESERRFTPFGAYARSKLANIMFAYEAAERWSGSGVSVNAMHPGVITSDIGRSGWGPAGFAWNHLVPKRSPAEGAKTAVWLAVSPEVEGASGLYFFRQRVKRSSRAAYDRTARRTLWNISARLTGITRDADDD